MSLDACEAYSADVATLARAFVEAIQSGRFDWEEDFHSKLDWDIRHHPFVSEPERRAITLKCSPNRSAIEEWEKHPPQAPFPQLTDASPTEQDVAHWTFWWDVWIEMGTLLGDEPDNVILRRMDEQK
jgi:hypothetical protein